MLRRMRRWLGLALRVLGTGAGLAYIATRVDMADAKAAIGRISIGAFLAAIALVALNVVAGAVRWRVLMRAYGATAIPSLSRATYLYFVAFFYNNYLPGAVAGDVGRGVVARDAFPDEGATSALAVVLVERALGLFALFSLLALGILTTGGAIDTRELWLWTALGWAGSITLVLSIAGARRLAPVLPAFLATRAAKLPVLVDRGAFAAAAGWSVVTQALTAAAGWVILAALAPIGPAASLLLVPLAAATTFLPITVGGTGAREAVYITLGGTLFGLSLPDALAASLGFWFAHLAVGAAGGVAQLVGRRQTRA
jgi:uncharacterized membrane protein YbhN (UPF0104 family)